MGKYIQGKHEPTLGELGAPTWVRDIIDGVPEGIRHDSAVRLVGRWYGLGLCSKEVRFGLEVWNRRNLPPLSSQEIESTFRSTVKWEKPRWEVRNEKGS